MFTPIHRRHHQVPRCVRTPARRWRHSLLACCLLLWSGCGGESTHQKMMRMAEARAKINAAEKSRVAEAAATPATEAVAASSAEKPAEASTQVEAQTQPESPANPPTQSTEVATDQETAPPTENAPPTEATAEPNPDAVAVEPAAKPKRLPIRAFGGSRSSAAVAPSQPVSAPPSSTEVTIADALLDFALQNPTAAYVGESGVIGIYGTNTGRLTRQIYSPELNPSSLSVSDQANHLAVGGRDGHFKVFPLDSVNSYDRFQQIRMMQRDAITPPRPHTTAVTATAVSDSAAMAASGDTEGIVKLWSIGQPSSMDVPRVRDIAAPVDFLTLSPDGNSWFGAIQNRVVHWTRAKETSVDATSAELTADGSPFIAGRFDGLESEEAISSLTVSTDGTMLAIGTVGGRAMLWSAQGVDAKRNDSQGSVSQGIVSQRSASQGDESQGKQLVSSTLSTGGGPISNLAISEDLGTLVTVSQSGDVSRWPLPIQPQTTFKTVEPTALVTASPQGNLLGLGSQKRNLDLYDATSGKGVRRHTLPNAELTAAEFSSDGAIVALATNDGRVVFQDDQRRTIAFTQLSSKPIIGLSRSSDMHHQYAFITTEGMAGVAAFPSRPLSPVSVAGNLACIDSSREKLLIVRDQRLHLVSLIESKLLASVEVKDQPITALCLEQDSAFVGTTAGNVWKWSLVNPDQAPVASVEVQAKHQSPVIAVGLDGTGNLLSCDRSGLVVQTQLSASNETAVATATNSATLFQMSAPPTAVSIRAGNVHAIVGASLESWIAGSPASAKPWQSARPLSKMAVDRTNGRFAVCDDVGQLTILDSDGNLTKQFQLPVQQAAELLWSDDGTRILAGNGKRLMIFVADSGQLESQCALESASHLPVCWSGNQLWWLDNSGKLQQMHLPRLNWSIAMDQEGAGVAWNATSNTIAALTRLGTVARFDAASGQEQARVATGKDESRSLVSIPNTNGFAWLASNADLMRMGDDGQVERLPITSALGLRNVAISTDGQTLYATNAIGKIASWNLLASSEAGSVIPCDLATERALPLGTGQLLAVSGQESVATVVPLSQQSQSTLRLGGPAAAVVLSGNGIFAGLADQTDTIRLHSLTDGSTKELREEGLTFDRMALDRGGDRAAAIGRTADDRRELLLWTTNNMERLGKVELPAGPLDVRFAGDGQKIAVKFEDGHCEVFSADTLTMLESTPSTPELRSFAFTADGNGIVTSTTSGIDLQPLTALGQLKTEQNAIVGLRFIDGDPIKLVCGSRDGRISLWSAQGSNEKIGTFEGIEGPLSNCQLSADGKMLCAVYEDSNNTVCLWKLDTLPSESAPAKPTMVIQNVGRNHCATFSRDSQFLLIGGGDGNIYAWKLDENRLVASFGRHEGRVLDILPSEQSGLFVSGGEDGSVKSGQFPSILPATGEEVSRDSLSQSLAFAELEKPKELMQENRDPNDAARQALVSGASTADVLDLIGADQEQVLQAKQALTKILSLESGSLTDSAELSRQRREFLASQRRLSTGDQVRAMASFAEGFSNLAFTADTNFKFGTDREYRPVRLMFADRYLYAARTSATHPQQRQSLSDAPVDEGDNGALLSWDYRYSRLQAHAWSLENLSVRELFPLPNSAGVFTVPQMLLFMQDGSSRELQKAASWATSDSPDLSRKFLAIGTEGAHRSESDILKIFDVAELSNEVVSPLSQYRGFEGIVTAMAFANRSSSIAFAVRSRADHRLFIADAETMQLHKIDEFDHESPWIEIDTDSLMTRTNPDASPGITSLAFSPDDRMLVAHGRYKGALHKFTKWSVNWDDTGSFVSAKKSIKEIENETAPLIQESGSKSIWFVQSPTKKRPESKDADGQIAGTTQYRVLVRVHDGFMVVNANSNLETRKIDFVTTHQGTPQYAISDDGRWLIMGDDSGLAYIWDTIDGDRYSVTIDPATEAVISSTDRKAREIPERPAHTGPIAGVALSKPDPGRDYPAFAATFGEENKIKVWELFPILDPEHGVRSQSSARYPVSRTIPPKPADSRRVANSKAKS